MTCPATILVRGQTDLGTRVTKHACEKDAGHPGAHEAYLTGAFGSVMWADGTTFVTEPGSWRGRRT